MTQLLVQLYKKRQTKVDCTVAFPHVLHTERGRHHLERWKAGLISSSSKELGTKKKNGGLGVSEVLHDAAQWGGRRG